MPDRPRRLPVSTRHAFALAFDLAVRRDPLHSLVVPLLLRAPWIVALAILPRPSESEHPGQVLAISSVAMLGDFLVFLLVTAMLRFRARSVFNTPNDQLPAPAWECYAQGLRRTPWLFVTETVRNLTLFVTFFLFVVPMLFLGFRLSFATEAVVLSERDLGSAFRRTFHLTDRRLERWLELIVGSVLMILGVTFFVALLSVLVPGPSMTAWGAITWLMVAMITPLIQYGWTFFYLRLVEIEEPMRAAGLDPAHAHAWPPAPAAPPQLTLVEPAAAPLEAPRHTPEGWGAAALAQAALTRPPGRSRPGRASLAREVPVCHLETRHTTPLPCPLHPGDLT